MIATSFTNRAEAKTPGSLRRGGLAPAEVPEATVDPQLGQLFLGAVLAETAAQSREIDAVEFLVLVEAGKNDGLGAARRVVVALQALRTDLLHHALHWRVDRGDRAVPRAEIALKGGAARLGDRGHHPVGADCDDAVDLRQRDLDRAQGALAISLDPRDDVADKGAVLRAAGRETRRLVAAPHDAVGGALDIGDPVAVLELLVAGEIKDARALGPKRRADRKEDRIAEPAADQEHRLARRGFGRGAGRAHQDDRLARLEERAEVG